jgi:outer membrane lipoprotein-sorting protein
MNRKILTGTLVIVSFMCLPRPDRSAQEPRAAYERMRTEINRVNTYTVTFEQFTCRGKNRELWSRRTARAKYIRKPRQYFEYTVKGESSFDAQEREGYQGCFNEKDDMIRLALPGAYRAVGIVPVFPEDPKAYYINGETLPQSAAWDLFAEWDRMLEGGSIQAEEVGDGKRLLITIRRGKIPDPDYHLDLVKILVDTATWFPARIEYYRPGDPQPTLYYDFHDLQLNAPLTADDVDFEGFTFGWNLARAPGGDNLDMLAAPGYEKLPDPAPAAPEFLEKLDQALASVRDYSVTMTTSLRFFRLRLHKTEKFYYLKSEQGFKLETPSLSANYILLSGAAGSRMYYLPKRDPLIHIFPGGIYKIVGEQTFNVQDPRIFTSMGDNLLELNLFSLRDKVRAKIKRSRVSTARIKDPSGIMIELKSTTPVGPREPGRMALLLDPQTYLPLRVDYRGYQDPDAFCLVEFSGLKTNVGLGAADLLK